MTQRGDKVKPRGCGLSAFEDVGGWRVNARQGRTATSDGILAVPARVLPVNSSRSSMGFSAKVCG